MGHWHEIKDEETIHCYEISDTLVSVDKITFGYSNKVNDNDIYQTMVENSSFELLKTREVKNDQIVIGDSILWIKAKNDSEAFISDLSVGLLLQVRSPELVESGFELPYNTLGTKIYVGQLKDKPHDRILGNQYYIQINDVIASINDLENFFNNHHGGNETQIAIIHADKNTPKGLLNAIINRITITGYLSKNIYRTVIDSEKKKMGLVRCQ
jgi:hypothetical protein